MAPPAPLGSLGGGGVVHLRLNDPETSRNPHINFITVLPRPDRQVALTRMRQLAAMVKPVMARAGLQINSLEEFEPNREFAGRCWNYGEVVELVLRDQRGGFLPLQLVLMVFCHELAHIKHMNHIPRLHGKLMADLKQHCRELQSRGYFGDGLWSAGQRLGDSTWQGGLGMLQPEQSLPQDICGGAFRRRRGGGRGGAARGGRPAKRRRTATDNETHYRDDGDDDKKPGPSRSRTMPRGFQGASLRSGAQTPRNLTASTSRRRVRAGAGRFTGDAASGTASRVDGRNHLPSASAKSEAHRSDANSTFRRRTQAVGAREARANAALKRMEEAAAAAAAAAGRVDAGKADESRDDDGGREAASKAEEGDVKPGGHALDRLEWPEARFEREGGGEASAPRRSKVEQPREEIWREEAQEESVTEEEVEEEEADGDDEDGCGLYLSDVDEGEPDHPEVKEVTVEGVEKRAGSSGREREEAESASRPGSSATTTSTTWASRETEAQRRRRAERARETARRERSSGRGAAGDDEADEESWQSLLLQSQVSATQRDAPVTGAGGESDASGVQAVTEAAGQPNARADGGGGGKEKDDDEDDEIQLVAERKVSRSSPRRPSGASGASRGNRPGGAPNEATSASASTSVARGSSTTAPRARPMDIEWACLLCTLLNPPGAERCDACGTRRGATVLGE